MYELLVVVHILSGIAWVGGAFLFMLGVRGIRNSEGHVAAERTMVRLEKASKLMNPTPFLVLATGITMVVVNDAWAFSQVWVYVSLALFAVVLTLGAVFEEGLQKRMQRARNEGRHEPLLLDRFIRIGFLDIAFFTGIVVLMVYKPV